MLKSEREIKMKLRELAERFSHHMRRKEYALAKACYDTAVTAAVFLELDEDFRLELFGERGERGVILRRGLFSEESVLKAMWECIKSGDTYENAECQPIYEPDYCQMRQQA